MDDRFLQQLKKGVLEMLVLETVCNGSTYGYELLTKLKAQSDALFTLKEGTLYPILYRLEDDGMIQSSWSQGEVKPQSAIIPLTLSGSFSPAAISTVVAPIEMPPR